jgi:hypothetical protein
LQACLFDLILVILNILPDLNLAPCSLGLSVTSQQYFSLTTNQQPASSTFLSEQTSTSHQPPAKRTGYLEYFVGSIDMTGFLYFLL